MYESPWLSIQWRCFQTCFMFQYSFTLDWHTQPGHKKVLWTSTSTLTLLQIQGKEKQGEHTCGKEVWNHHQQLKGRMGLQSKLGTIMFLYMSLHFNQQRCVHLDIVSRFLLHMGKVRFAIPEGLLGKWWAEMPLMSSEDGISKVPNCKGCCWKTWFPGTRCYTNLGYHGFWWRKEMDLGISGWTNAGKTHTLTVNLIFLKLTLRVDAGLRKRLPACQNGNDAWWFCSKPTNCTPQENNPTDRHWTTPNKSTSHLPKMFSAIVLYEHLRACFHF